MEIGSYLGNYKDILSFFLRQFIEKGLLFKIMFILIPLTPLEVP